MATEFERLTVRNIDRNSLLLAISEREDVVEVIEMFKDVREYTPRKYVTIKEFAEYIKASEKYVRELAKQGESNNWFATTKVGREYRIDIYSYEKWGQNGGVF